MRAVVQRASSASVLVDDDVVGELTRPGLVVLLGVGPDDDESDARALARKLWGLRILDGERSASETGAPFLVVSQFTLFASTKKGRRPSWSQAAPAAIGEPLVRRFVEALREQGAEVAEGRFGAHMRLALVNDGPVTIWIDTARWE